MLYKYCRDRNIPHKNVGKLVVATNEAQRRHDLQRILNHATKNGADMQLLSGDDVRRNLEPNVTCHGALYSPSTGIVDSHEVMSSLLADAEDSGAILALQSPVDGVCVSNDKMRQNIILKVCGMDLQCNTVINCAGLYAGHIASQIFDSINSEGKSIPISRKFARQYFAKGNYFKLEGQKTPFQHLIYPVPEEKGGLGVHSTIDLSGAIKFGPDVEWVNKSITNPSDIDMTVDSSRAYIFYSEVRKYWPDLQDGSLVPDYAGIRPKLGHISDHVGGASIYNDFLIDTYKNHNLHGFINLLGIESPGLTSSMAIAEYVSKFVNEQ